MKVTLHRSVTTSLRVGFTQHARDLDEPEVNVPITMSVPKDLWLVDMGQPETIEIEVPTT